MCAKLMVTEIIDLILRISPVNYRRNDFLKNVSDRSRINGYSDN